MKHFLIFVLLTALLCGCSAPQPAVVETQPAIQLPEPQTSATEPSTEAPTEATDPPIPQNTVTFQYCTEDLKEYAIITGIDPNGSTVWTYETPRLDMAQMVRVSDVGTWQDRYYFIEDRTVVALDLATGEVLWKNSDFIGAPAGQDAMYIDTDGTVYLCGYLGPDFYAISCDGVTLARTDSFDSNWFWPYKLEKADNGIVIYFEGSLDGYAEEDPNTVTVPLPLA